MFLRTTHGRCTGSLLLGTYAFTFVTLVATVSGGAACSAEKATASAAIPKQSSQPEEPLPPSDLETRLPEAVRDAVLKRFTGDFDEMIERKVVRVGVSPSRTFYFVDKGVQRGVAYEYGQLMEDRINAKLGSKNIKVHVFFVPMSREKLIPALVDGTIDLAAGSLTLTPERQALVDFSDPTRTNVSEIVVTGPGSPALTSLEDLSGRRIFVRKSSAYESSLLTLNEKLKAGGKPPVAIEFAPENLGDDDLLEMVNAGLLPAVIVDDYVARFWKKVFPALVLHEKVAVRSGSNLGVAIRKNNPQLRSYTLSLHDALPI